MSNVWRIFVVEGEEALNRSLVNALRKDGFVVHGVTNGADAVRVLWTEEYDVVIGDLKTPGVDSFELLRWLRTYRPNTRVIMLGVAGSPELRMQVLENGAASFLEKPLDIRDLKEELRRLLQQTGFSANLDSFDLLDVIQIINMSHKSITLLVNTGLEERGILHFNNGELIWAEYGLLRGEEAFFALAAHKNGTVIHQPWSEQVVANVTQPLSRLVFQALQYRTKYANMSQISGEHEVVSAQAFTEVISTQPFTVEEIDDTPFMVISESEDQIPLPQQVQDEAMQVAASYEQAAKGEDVREWWERTGKITSVNTTGASEVLGENEPIEAAPTVAFDGYELANSINANGSPTGPKLPITQRTDLPSWLTDQPTATEMPVIQTPMTTNTRSIPTTPIVKSSSPEWDTPAAASEKTTDKLAPKPPMVVQESPSRTPASVVQSWQAAEQTGRMAALNGTQGVQVKQTDEVVSFSDLQESNPRLSTTSLKVQRAAKRNYAALVSALQTMGYSIPGFIAAAVVSIEGQLIAQIAVDDLDISKMCKPFSMMLRDALQSLEQGNWGSYEHLVITSSERRILMRPIGNERVAFQVLIMTHEADAAEGLEVMANVEGAVSAALR